jgi:hypothetical protein
MAMSHEEAISEVHQHLDLVGREFQLHTGEKETVKAVVAWDEGKGNWQPHVCFYDWDEESPDGEIIHMNLFRFMEEYSLQEK